MVIDALDSNEVVGVSTRFDLMAVAGGGKTFCASDALEKHLHAKAGSARSACVVASTSIAAGVHKHGATAHSRFLLPVTCSNPATV